jgi:predicted dehydrogenase
VIRVGIIGCGKVADKHASQIRRVRGSRIVGVCDRERLMAGQLAERYGIGDSFDDVHAMLAACKPDVVHITTPPQSHYALARQCLEAGCHIYVEKPFTLNGEEAKELIDIAQKVGRKLTVGHETQFMPVARDMRRLIQAGYLGGAPVHMESIYGYEFTDERYAKAVLGDRNHWVRSLPGGLLQNIISHGIGKIAEYLQNEDVMVIAHGFTSPFLDRIGESDVIDELRVILSDGRRTTAHFLFSSQISPALHQFSVYGPTNSLIADHEHQTLIRVPREHYKSYLKQFIPPFSDAGQYVTNGCRNIHRFLKKEFHAESGMYVLMDSFYRSLTDNAPLPVPYRDILLTARIIDAIFAQIGSGAGHNAPGTLYGAPVGADGGTGQEAVHKERDR